VIEESSAGLWPLAAVSDPKNLSTPIAIAASCSPTVISVPFHTSTGTGIQTPDEIWEDDYNNTYDGTEPFGTSGTIIHEERLRANFATFGLDMKKVLQMMQDTSAVIGGGFMVNHILAMNGIDKPLCPAADIDFYVYGGISPVCTVPFGCQGYREYLSKSIQARTFRTLVTRRFYDLVSSVGYTYAYPNEDDYMTEQTTEGDRVFTSRSNIRMSVIYYSAVINGIKKTLNLVFCDTDLYTFIQKVDISLTAGFLCPSSYSESFDYHHAAPQDVIEGRLAWMQPESTHTPRQIARMEKYRQRYNLLEHMKMSTDEFIRDWDSLPDKNIRITLVGTEDEIHSQSVIRRVLGLPDVEFNVQMTHYSRLGESITYSHFPTASERADYARQKTLAQPGVHLGQCLVHYDDKDDA
jgi:hypothetical protein